MKLQILVCYSVFTESKYKQGIQNHNSINQQTFFFVRCLVVSPPFSCSTSSSSSSSSSSFLFPDPLRCSRKDMSFRFCPWTPSLRTQHETSGPTTNRCARQVHQNRHASWHSMTVMRWRRWLYSLGTPSVEDTFFSEEWVLLELVVC